MNSKRKLSNVAAHRTTRDDKQAHRATVRFETEDEFFARVRKAVSDVRDGRTSESAEIISFESVGALLALLTPKRYEMFETVKQRGGFESIEALALELNRDRAAVSRDLKALTDAGLLQVRRSAQAGHGTRSEIAPIGARLTLEVVL